MRREIFLLFFLFWIKLIGGFVVYQVVNVEIVWII